MKKNRSMWMLYAGSTAKGLLLILIGMAAVESGLFWYTVTSSMSGPEPYQSISDLMGMAKLHVVFFAAFVLWSLVLTVFSHTKAVYTLDRLRVTPIRRLVIHALYNTLSYVVLIAAQVGVAVGLVLWYKTQVDVFQYGPQSMLMAFYMSDFLRNLFPLGEVLLVVKNILLMGAMGLLTASVSVGLRTSNGYLVPLAMAMAHLAFFYLSRIGYGLSGLGTASITWIFAGGVAFAVWPILKGVEGYDKE